MHVHMMNWNTYCKEGKIVYGIKIVSPFSLSLCLSPLSLFLSLALSCLLACLLSFTYHQVENFLHTLNLPVLSPDVIASAGFLLYCYYCLHSTHTHTHTHTAQNVLVFDGGRTVKLTDFGTAVAVGEVTSKQGLKGLMPYFAAPEIIKGEVPKFSADIWSALCILIEMLTAKWPGCHKVERNDMANVMAKDL